MNPFIILGPIGMVVVGLLSILTWKLKRNVRMKYFVFGGLIWIVSILPKVAMDVALISATISRWARELFYPSLTFFLVIGAYAGFRTGIFETFFPYLAIARSGLKRITFNEAIAFGIGFGAFEAILIAIPFIINIAVFLTNPSILQLLPPQQREFIIAQLSLPTWVVFAPMIERALTILIHVFSILLILISITHKKPTYLIASFFYKSSVDAAIPYLNYTFNPSLSPVGAYLCELWVALLALIAIAGIHRISKLGKIEEARPSA